MTDLRLSRPFHSPAGCRLLGLAVVAALLLNASPLPAAEKEAEIEGRLADATAYLASDKLEGRGVGTKGLGLAADYLYEQFRQMGLKTALVDGRPFQPFEVTTGATLGKHNSLSFIGPDDETGASRQIALKLGEEFTPLAIGGSRRFHVPLAFAGYGITGRNEKYDDYENVDVKGKAVIILRHEPQQDNPHSAFNGAENSRHATFRSKVSNAYQHGAAAVILVTDQYELEKRVEAAEQRLQVAIDELARASDEFKENQRPTLDDYVAHQAKVEKLAADIERYAERMQAEMDPVLEFYHAGQDPAGRDMPVLHVRRAALDPIIKAALGKSLAELEEEIDHGPAPRSAVLEGWQVVGQTSIDRERTTIKNVVAVLEGEGPHADETVVIGAHYDHLGYGGQGSAKPGSDEIHNGADDNASGTAVLLEIARELASRDKKPPRRVVFIAFTGEERGLLGSAHYIKHPLFPLDKTVAMLNMDMVGRLRDNKLIVNGVDTAKEFSDWLEAVNEQTQLELVEKLGGFGPSDHASFYAKKIPVLHFFTGSHKDYHRPSDDADKLNLDGMRRVARLVTGMAAKIAAADAPPTYQESKRPEVARRGGTRPYFGSIPDFSHTAAGYALAGVAKGSPAERAGIRGGDVVIRFGESKIGNLSDIDLALRQHKAGEKVPVVVLRGGKKLTFEVTLDPPR